MFKSKCTKTDAVGALFEVLMSKNCTPLWRNANLQVKMLKNWRSRSTFWSSAVEKLHAAVAKSVFWSQNVKKTEGLGALFEVQMSKSCTPLWREANLQAVEKLHAAVAKSVFWSQNVKKNCGSGSTFWSSDAQKLQDQSTNQLVS